MGNKGPRTDGKPGRFGTIPPRVLVSAVILFIIAFWAVFPDAGGKGALQQDVLTGTLPPLSPGHILGTDALGRDILKLTIAGTRSAVAGPLCIAAGSLLLGLLLGSFAGYAGGLPDWIISRYTDLTLAMPSLLLAIVAAGIIGGGYWVSVGVMIILYSPFDIRLIRSAVIAEKKKNYIEAARILRLSPARILSRHIFPNIALMALVNFFLNIAYGLVSMSSLSFLGVGVSPGAADWGRQLADSRSLLFENPAAALSPGFAVILTSVSINIVGTWLAEQKTVDA
jgi:peptide/nickel transport system permease protein